MSEPTLVYETDIATTPDQLWAALTDGRRTREYWFDRRIESDWKVGSPVRFYDGASDVVTDSGTVLECDPPRRLVYSFRQEIEGEGARPGRPHTRVAFDLEPIEGGRVRLRLVHDELERPEDVEGWRQGWSPIFDSLRKYLEAAGTGPTGG